MKLDEQFVITISREVGSGGRTIGRALAEKLVIDHHIQHLDWLHAGRVLPGLGVQVLVLLDTVIQILGGDHRGLGQIYGGGRIADGGEHIAGCNQDARDDGCDTFHEASSPLIRDSP